MASNLKKNKGRAQAEKSDSSSRTPSPEELLKMAETDEHRKNILKFMEMRKQEVAREDRTEMTLPPHEEEHSPVFLSKMSVRRRLLLEEEDENRQKKRLEILQKQQKEFMSQDKSKFSGKSQPLLVRLTFYNKVFP